VRKRIPISLAHTCLGETKAGAKLQESMHDEAPDHCKDYKTVEFTCKCVSDSLQALNCITYGYLMYAIPAFVECNER